MVDITVHIGRQNKLFLTEETAEKLGIRAGEPLPIKREFALAGWDWDDDIWDTL